MRDTAALIDGAVPHARSAKNRYEISGTILAQWGAISGDIQRRRAMLLNSLNWENGQSIKPAIYKGPPIPDLEDYLQDKYDGGEFLVIIRRGETMLESGLIDVCPLPSRKEAFEAFKAKYGW